MESHNHHHHDHHGHHDHNGHFSQTCRHEIQDFVKCTKERLRAPTSGHDRGDISECTALADRYAECIKTNKLVPKGERNGPDQKLAPPPPCEMETAVYGQCMANLLDSEVRRRRQGGEDTSLHLDTNKCKFTLSAFEKCIKAAPVESQMVDDPQSTQYQSPTYYWMSSIYWQAPGSAAKH